MARFLLLMVLFVVIARTFWRFFDAVMRGASTTQQGGGRRPGPPASVKMQQCPVCGTYVVPGKAISMISGGQPVYFDSEACRSKYQPQ